MTQRQGRTTQRPRGSILIWSTITFGAVAALLGRGLGHTPTVLSDRGVCLLLLTTLGLTLLALGLHQRSSQHSPAASWHDRFARAVVTLLPPFVLALGISPHPSPVTLSFAGALFLFAAGVLLHSVRRQRSIPSFPSSAWERAGGKLRFPIREAELRDVRSQAELGNEDADEGSTDDGPRTTDEPEAATPADALDQYSYWQSRTAQPDGSESISGVAQVPFADGQKEAVLHLTFCPALTTVPEITCEDLDDGTLRLKVAAVYPFGARIEVKRTGRELPAAAVRVGYTAMASQSQRRAA